MVQIIPRAPTSLERFMQALSGGLQGATSGAERIQNMMREKAQRKTLQERFGSEFGNIHDPDLRKQLLSGALERENISQKMRGQYATDEESSSIISKYLGKEAAEIWPHLTDGGKTELFRAFILGKERGKNTNDIISQYFQSNPQEVQNVVQNISDQKDSNSEMSAEFSGISEKGREELSKKDIEESGKYLKEVREKYQRAQTLKPVFNELRDTVRAGGTDALSWGNLADLGGKMGGFLGNTVGAVGKSLESGETGKFRALSKKLLDEMKDIFGGQIRVKELEVFLSMLPEIGKSKEANLAAIDVLERLSEASSMFYDTAQEIIQKNNGKIPKDLADKVQKKLKPVLSDIASNIHSTTKSFEKQKKSLTKDIASEILKEAKGDKSLARKIAKQRGYEF